MDLSDIIAWGAVAGSSLLMTALLLAPIRSYWRAGHGQKRSEIMDSLGVKGRIAYFRMFRRAHAVPTLETALTEFENFYDHDFGIGRYRLPTALVALVGMSMALVVSIAVCTRLGLVTQPALVKLDGPTLAALLGGYMWVVNDFINRSRRLDFAPSDLLWGCLRLVVSAPMGLAFATITGAAAPSSFVAFAVGAFPLTTLLTFLRRIVVEKAKLGAEDAQSTDLVTKLQGVDKSISDRLRGEDVLTISQMAYSDPVRLSMRCGLGFDFVADLASQSLAWIYFGDKMDTLRPKGLRGAVEIRHLIEDMDIVVPSLPASVTPEESKSRDELQARKDQAVKCLPILAAAVGLSSEGFMLVAQEIAQDPFTDFLDYLWDLRDDNAAETP